MTEEKTNSSATPENASSAGENAPAEVSNGAAALSGELKRLRSAIEEKDAEIKHLKNQLMYALADFDNFRKRKERELQFMRKNTISEIILNFLPVIDTMEAMEKNLSDAKGEELVTGLLGIKKKFAEVLSDIGVREIDAKYFDAGMHEVESVVPGDEENKVVEVIRKGYMFEDKVIRPARVIIARKKEAQ
jgi:molecular chaperone GrpE